MRDAGQDQIELSVIDKNHQRRGRTVELGAKRSQGEERPPQAPTQLRETQSGNLFYIDKRANAGRAHLPSGNTVKFTIRIAQTKLLRQISPMQITRRLSRDDHDAAVPGGVPGAM
jgi:hypothetical protein